MWRKFKGHAVVGAGGVIGERGKIIENSAQGKKMDSNSGGTGSSLGCCGNYKILEIYLKYVYYNFYYKFNILYA